MHTQLALIIDGATLAFALHDDIKLQFLDLAKQSKVLSVYKKRDCRAYRNSSGMQWRVVCICDVARDYHSVYEGFAVVKTTLDRLAQQCLHVG